jgi:hypothetical protein
MDYTRHSVTETLHFGNSCRSGATGRCPPSGQTRVEFRVIESFWLGWRECPYNRPRHVPGQSAIAPFPTTFPGPVSRPPRLVSLDFERQAVAGAIFLDDF